MTKEEAIRHLEEWQEIISSGKRKQVIDMAIEALQTAEINCVHCPHYHETEDDIGVHSHCGSHGRLIDADALMEKIRKEVYRHDYIEHVYQIIDNAPTVPVVDITQRDFCKDINCEDCPFMQETCKLMDYVAYAEAVQGWIPCSERLPMEKDDWVLVTKRGKVRIATYSEFDCTWYVGEMCAVGGEDPIAWMPLPTPYKGGDE